MIRETYKGRKLTVRKGPDGGLVGAINGQQDPVRYGVTGQDIINQLHRDIDLVGEEVNGARWGAYMYAPGTYELCGNGHPRAVGSACLHPYCQEAARS